MPALARELGLFLTQQLGVFLFFSLYLLVCAFTYHLFLPKNTVNKADFKERQGGYHH